MRPLLLILLFCGGVILSAQTSPTVVFEDLGLNLSAPVDLTHAGDGSDRLFAVQRNGLIKVIDLATNELLEGDYLDIVSRVRSGGERGLLGLAFHPDFASNGYFFVNYTSRTRGDSISNGTSVIARFQAETAGSGQVNPETEVILLTVRQPFGNHNAGDLAFGPDGYLYVPFGDGGSANDPDDYSQDSTALLGKMLRLDVDNPAAGKNYGIPADNPYLSFANVPDEVWAFGLRNPWRIAFDRSTGDLWIADVGQGAREEVSVQPATSTGGENYGWDCREGNLGFGQSSVNCDPTNNYRDPIFDYGRSSVNGGQSITGGYVYRGTQADDLLGHYLCADYESNNFFLLTPEGANGRELILQPVGDSIRSISTFGEAENGDLYAASLNGEVYHLTSNDLTVSNAQVFNEVAPPTLSPNPTSGAFMLDLPRLKTAGTVSLHVLTEDGRVVYNRLRTLAAGPHQLAHVLPAVPAGLYQVVVRYEGASFALPLVVK